ncbi:tryptophan-rich sensory protein [Tenacibaculum tangerinum]|uniref:Tryptophan-rich sensory protein n=1 Tax=Tenacibaculum tangerinum TaxID=3038772 RepID=A0ABY8KZL1_9FLAO|nr:tryptophan-rich sensory protein [Tenacibaculum tangerinum]WGH74281.1 tryptophan-rich sensory protein [Tenacibaculum tangerinum]
MKENKYIRFLVFLVANFLALGIGSWLMNDGPNTDWYQSLNKAPWTPPGWVFGAAWTTIMLLFAVYMTKVSFKYPYLSKKLLVLYGVQWILNVSWNYLFFNQHLTTISLVVIILLWLLIGYFTFKHLKQVKNYTFFILPYLVWMTIATSLNLYVVLNN